MDAIGIALKEIVSMLLPSAPPCRARLELVIFLLVERVGDFLNLRCFAVLVFKIHEMSEEIRSILFSSLNFRIAVLGVERSHLEYRISPIFRIFSEISDFLKVRYCAEIAPAVS